MRADPDARAKDAEGREKKIDGIMDLVRKEKEKALPQWYVNGQGQTMVVIAGPVEFMMGSPPSEKGRQGGETTQHKQRIGRTFALAAKSVTVEQHRQFDKNTRIPVEHPRTADLPVVGIDWYEAAAYCNWLSKEEGIPEDQWCYLPNAKIEYAEGMRLAPDYLKRTGYRLPTEAEMEYATRAGALTSRYFGETEELLQKYAWYLHNSKEQTWPVGSLKPNDLGLFDLQGNVFTWCQEGRKANHVRNDQEDGLAVVSTVRRAVRGGTYDAPARYVRSAHRGEYVPTFLSSYLGFRLARTLTP